MIESIASGDISISHSVIAPVHLVFNPFKYWRRYKASQLNRCLRNAFLEQCWNARYQTFVVRHRAFCIRNPLEEDPIWLIESCWNSAKRNRYYEHHSEFSIRLFTDS